MQIIEDENLMNRRKEPEERYGDTELFKLTTSLRDLAAGDEI